MLSGVGDPQHLSRHEYRGDGRAAGVGKNLQDRYEVGVVSRMKRPWKVLEGRHLQPQRLQLSLVAVAEDRQLHQQRRDVFNCTASRAAVWLALIFTAFRCWRFPGLLQRLFRTRSGKPNYLSWVVLKAYTQNRGGKFVALAHADPRTPPSSSFIPSMRATGDATPISTLWSRASASFAKLLMAWTGSWTAEEEPGRHLDSDELLRAYVSENAWGHHACGTCAIGPRDSGGVLDSRFRVYGVDGLRVVDASVFPRIPGYFLVTSVYMIAEKAADAILTEARSATKVSAISA